MAGYDYKKEEKTLYGTGDQPVIVPVPAMPFFMVEGCGNPNEEGGAYSEAVGLLYALSFTVKMSKMNTPLPGYFEYVVPPLEGLWWMDDNRPGIDYSRKEGFCWVSLIRQPDFVTEEVFRWACDEVQKKKKLDPSRARFKVWEEGLCAQILHHGPYDAEPDTVARLDAFITESGHTPDFSDVRRHHEIYLGDPRRTAPEKLRTIIRHPIR